MCMSCTDSSTISIIIPCLGRSEELHNCLKSIERVRDAYDLDVIVVDDCSDEPVASIVAEYDFAKCLRTAKRLGPATCKNLGARIARGEYLLFMDSDTEIIEPQAIKSMVDTLVSCPGIGIVGGECIFRERWMIPLRNVESDGRIHLEMVERTDLVEVGYISSSNLMIQVQMFNTVGGYFDQMFAYFEDSDLCAAVRFLGKKTCVSSDFVVRHFRSATARKVLLQHYLSVRNRLLYAAIHLPIRALNRCIFSIVIGLRMGRRGTGIRAWIWNGVYYLVSWCALASFCVHLMGALRRKRQLNNVQKQALDLRDASTH